MESFKVYLPSNACHLTFPNNSASDYKTCFDKPIELDGEWEVGVESVFYSSHIADNNAKALIHCEATVIEKYPANDDNFFKYKLSDEKDFHGTLGIVPDTFEEDPSRIDKVIQTLNVMNYELFEYYQTGFIFTNLYYVRLADGFYLRITPRIKELLGFQSAVFSAEQVMYSKKYRMDNKTKLTREDYRLNYFSTELQEKESRLILKSTNQEFAGGKEELLKLWNVSVASHKRLHVEFKGEKFIIDNFHEDEAFIFSPDLSKAIGHVEPLIGRGTTWGLRSIDVSKGRASEFWYIDVYSSKLKQKERPSFVPLTVEIYPWHFQAMDQLIVYINNQVNESLKSKLLKNYDRKRHNFSLSRSDHSHSKLVLGDGLKVCLSSNLEYVLAISSLEWLRKEIHGYFLIQNSLINVYFYSRI